MAYVYRHIRLDKNEPFYIGVGERERRSSAVVSRNTIWKRIVAKTKYAVEILFENVDYNFAREKEIEFIKLYGRIDNNTGILANMTNGGDGSLKHNYCKNHLYQTWTNIKKSYFDNKYVGYKSVGGKGLIFYEGWLDFESFNKWAVDNEWDENKKIVRKNKEDGFNPHNCIVVSRKIITYGESKYRISELSKKLNIPRSLVYSRLKDGWTIEKLISTPTIISKRNKLVKNKTVYNVS